MTPRVLVPKFDFLPWSERFIMDELAGLRRYAPTLWIRQLLQRSERLLRPPVTLLDERWPQPECFAERLLALVDSVPASLVYFEFASDGAQFLWRLPGRLPVPAVAAVRGYDVPAVDRDMPGGFPGLSARLDLFLVRSEEMAGRIERLGAPPGKIRVHHTGVPLDRFRAVARRAPDMPTFLCCSRYVEKKGIDDAIRAAGLLRDGIGATFRLAIFGEGPLEADYRRLVAALGLAGVVSVGGRIDRAGVRSALAGASALIQASRIAADGNVEGIPVVAIEALAVGTPVLATRHAGIPELVKEGEGGWLVPEGDPAALAAAMGRIVAGDGPDMAAARRRVGQEFDSARQNAALERIFDGLIAAHRRPTSGDRL